MLERCRIISMCYQIIELRNRNDLVKLLLENVDFALYVSRVLVSLLIKRC
jgi:hypothetical protein